MKTKRPTVTRKRGWRSLAEWVARAAGPAAARRGFPESSVLSQWPHIVGDHLANLSSPLRLSRRTGGRGGVLYIAVDGPHATLLQHQAPQIVERINTYLGHAAVENVVFRRKDGGGAKSPAGEIFNTLENRPTGEMALSTARPPLMAEKKKTVPGPAASPDNASDDGLENALKRLGSAVRANKTDRLAAAKKPF